MFIGDVHACTDRKYLALCHGDEGCHNPDGGPVPCSDIDQPLKSLNELRAAIGIPAVILGLDSNEDSPGAPGFSKAGRY